MLIALVFFSTTTLNKLNLYKEAWLLFSTQQYRCDCPVTLETTTSNDVELLLVVCSLLCNIVVPSEPLSLDYLDHIMERLRFSEMNKSKHT